MYPLFNIMGLETKIEKLEEQIKHPYYAGKPTRKQRKLEKLYEKKFETYISLKRSQMI